MMDGTMIRISPHDSEDREILCGQELSKLLWHHGKEVANRERKTRSCEQPSNLDILLVDLQITASNSKDANFTPK
jgi:hypothetical protein